MMKWKFVGYELVAESEVNGESQMVGKEKRGESQIRRSINLGGETLWFIKGLIFRQRKHNPRGSNPKSKK